MAEIPTQCPMGDICIYIADPQRLMDLSEEKQSEILGNYEVAPYRFNYKMACFMAGFRRVEFKTWFVDNYDPYEL